MSERKRKRQTKTAAGIIDVQVLGTGANNLAPSLLVRTIRGNYLFNAGDGLQRFFVEHKVKMGKIKGIFLTDLSSETIGGLPGALLTMSDLSADNSIKLTEIAQQHGNSNINSTKEDTSLSHHVQLYGPRGIGAFLYAMRHFFYRPDYSLYATEFTTQSCPVHLESDSGLQAVVPVLLSPSSTTNTTSSTPLPSQPPSQWNMVNHRMNLRVGESCTMLSSPSVHSSRYTPLPPPTFDTVVCYVCQTPSILGKFDAQRATALGVKGRDRGVLVRGGGPITLQDGRIIKRSDVMADDTPGVVFSILRCPTMEHAVELSSNLQHISSLNGTATKLLYHIVPTHVLTSDFYQQHIIAQCPPDALHILVNAHACPRVDVMLSGQRNVILLNQIHAGVFPFQEDVLDKKSDQSKNTNSIDKTTNAAASTSFRPRCVPADTKSVVRLVPVVSTPLEQDLTEVPALQLPDDVVREARKEQLLSDVHIQDLHSVERKCQSTTPLSSTITDEDPAITFLGTGSAIPSKHRNVTSILLQMNAGAMLIDAGEGTYHQLLRHVHGDQQKLDHLLSEIQLIWISHKHADHHLGLSLLLIKRALLQSATQKTRAPVVIVCPSPVIGWLSEIAAIDSNLQGTFICVACVVTASVHKPRQFYSKSQHRPASNVSASATDTMTLSSSQEVASATMVRRQGAPVTLSSAVDPLREALNALNLNTLESVSVNHCHLAYGIVLTSKAGWKLVYSGDTTPDRRLWERGQNADLLIHEATFDSEMEEDARKKRHSTVAGAIDVGKRMNATHVILTHFSQRYPRIVSLGDDAMNNVSVSFDFMTIRLSQLPWLPQMLPALQCLFPSVSDVDIDVAADKVTE